MIAGVIGGVRVWACAPGMPARAHPSARVATSHFGGRALLSVRRSTFCFIGVVPSLPLHTQPESGSEARIETFTIRSRFLRAAVTSDTLPGRAASAEVSGLFELTCAGSNADSPVYYLP